MTATAFKPNYLPKVREQYEALPYPPYDPEQDRLQLNATAGDRLDYLNHRFFDGLQTFGKGFRALCAGDGTGNSSIILGEQLYELGGEVVSLDLSAASQAIAKRRATLRKLTNITHINASLLDLPTLGLGEFDYINCSGVLHHLADPDAGLRALASALKPGGVMCIMVYATVGRTAVYQMQEMLRLLMHPDDPMDEQIALTRTVLAHLPRKNWFWFNNAPFMNDITQYGDSGIFDLLLHTQDRAYTVPEVYEWLDRTGLTMGEFCPMNAHPEPYYDPATYVPCLAGTEELASLSLPERQALAELLAGNMCMHIFYAHKGKVADELSGDDGALIPAFSFFSSLRDPFKRDLIEALRTGVGNPMVTAVLPTLAKPLRFTPLATTADLLAAIDNTRSIAEILEQVTAQHPALSANDIAHQWQHLYDELRQQLQIVLRRAEGARITSTFDLQQRSFARMDR